MTSKIIIGAGRQAAETYYLMEDLGIVKDVICFASDDVKPGQEFLGLPVLSIDSILNQYSKTEKPAVFIAIGAVNAIIRLSAIFREAGFPFFNVLHSSINLKRFRFLGEGVLIGEGSVLTCNISIGDNSIINIGCTISHDCTIGNHVNISPGSHLAGNVTIEDDVFVGTGATFIPKVRIGRGSIVAAGAVVTKDVPPFSMVAGVPAKVKKTIK